MIKHKNTSPNDHRMVSVAEIYIWVFDNYQGSSSPDASDNTANDCDNKQQRPKRDNKPIVPK